MRITGEEGATPLSPTDSPHMMSRTRSTPWGCVSSPVCATNFRLGKDLYLKRA